MIDCILYVSDFRALVIELNANHSDMLLRSEDGSLASPPVVTGFARTPAAQNGDKLMVYARLTEEAASRYRTIQSMEVLAEAPFAGAGTANAVYQQINDDPEKLAKYESVYSTDSYEVPDGEGGMLTITPPFRFGMMAGA